MKEKEWELTVEGKALQQDWNRENKIRKCEGWRWRLSRGPNPRPW